MWEWVEPALQYGGAPIVAAGAVLLAQRMANQRERQRIESERLAHSEQREHELRLLERQERAAAEERWRRDRRDAYERFARVLEDVSTVADQMSTATQRDNLTKALVRWHKMADDLWDAWATVRLIGTEAALDSGSRAMARLKRLDAPFLRYSTFNSWAGREDLHDVAREISDCLKDFVEVARADLDVG